jgi:hypothetical protein
MSEMSATAGIIPEGALQKEATPAGSDKTPAPTIPFTRLNIEAVDVDVPPCSVGSSCLGTDDEEVE